jgi:hypothetical protein
VQEQEQQQEADWCCWWPKRAPVMEQSEPLLARMSEGEDPETGGHTAGPAAPDLRGQAAGGLPHAGGGNCRHHCSCKKGTLLRFVGKALTTAAIGAFLVIVANGTFSCPAQDIENGQACAALPYGKTCHVQPLCNEGFHAHAKDVTCGVRWDNFPPTIDFGNPACDCGAGNYTIEHAIDTDSEQSTQCVLLSTPLNSVTMPCHEMVDYHQDGSSTNVKHCEQDLGAYTINISNAGSKHTVPEFSSLHTCDVPSGMVLSVDISGDSAGFDACFAPPAACSRGVLTDPGSLPIGITTAQGVGGSLSVNGNGMEGGMIRGLKLLPGGSVDIRNMDISMQVFQEQDEPFRRSS